VVEVGSTLKAEVGIVRTTVVDNLVEVKDNLVELKDNLVELKDNLEVVANSLMVVINNFEGAVANIIVVGPILKEDNLVEPVLKGELVLEEEPVLEEDNLEVVVDHYLEASCSYLIFFV